MINYEITGPDDAPVLLLLHGFMGSMKDWDGLETQLPDWRLLKVDLPGHGTSDISADWTMADCCRDILTCLDACGITTCHICGYSMGGRLALQLIALAPERFESAVIVSAAPWNDDPDRLSVDQERAATIKADFSAFLDNWYRLPLFGNLREQPDFSALLGERLKRDPENLAIALLVMSSAGMPADDILIRECQIPLIYVAGEQDKKYVAMSAAVKAANIEAEIVIVPGCGHALHLEDRTAFAKLLKKKLTR